MRNSGSVFGLLYCLTLISTLASSSCKVSRDVELLTVLHGGESHAQSALHHYMEFPLKALSESMSDGNKWSYATTIFCDPPFTQGHDSCLQSTAGGWTNGNETSAWNHFMSTVNEDKPCTLGTRDVVPLPEYLIHAAAFSGFSDVSKDVHRIIVLFARSGPQYRQYFPKHSFPSSFDCQDSSTVSIEQFQRTLTQIGASVFVVAPPIAATRWLGFARKAKLNTKQLTVWEVPATSNNQTPLNLQWWFAHFLCNLDSPTLSSY